MNTIFCNKGLEESCEGTRKDTVVSGGRKVEGR